MTVIVLLTSSAAC